MAYTWMVNKLLSTLVLVAGVVFAMFHYPAQVSAEETQITQDRYMLGRVEKILEEGFTETADASQPYQKLQVQIISGPDRGKVAVVDHGVVLGIYKNQTVSQGQKIVLVKTTSGEQEKYYVSDKYRLPALGWFLLLFLACVIFLGKWRGLASILGLAFSVLILAGYVIPAIAGGNSPLVASVVGAVAIIFLSLYMSHGLNKRTTVSVVATVIVLVLAATLGALITWLASLYGTGSEEAFYLQIGQMDTIDMKGLFLGGMIIGALGVLDDITTSQAAAVEEISEANINLSVHELYRRGISIGTEHIASLTNTLALAYVGASFPLLLLFNSNHNQPLWTLVNSEMIAEEVVRTLVGSLALVLAVPVVTYLAAVVFAADPARGKKRPIPHHHHH